MKLYLRTWRYSVDTNQGYHGSEIKIDAQNMLLHVLKPVIVGGEGQSDIVGELTTVTIIAGDELTVIQCEGCEHHPEEPSAEKTVGFFPQPLDTLRGRF